MISISRYAKLEVATDNYAIYESRLPVRNGAIEHTDFAREMKTIERQIGNFPLRHIKVLEIA